MITYFITPGYNPNLTTEKANALFQAIIMEVRKHPLALISLLKKEGSWSLKAFPYLESYGYDNEDAFLREGIDEETGNPFVRLTASGYGEPRQIKEKCHRAFCRYVLDQAHSIGVEVSLIVA